MCLVSGINLCASILSYSEESFSTVAIHTIPRKIDHLTRVASQRHMGKLIIRQGNHIVLSLKLSRQGEGVYGNNYLYTTVYDSSTS